MREIQMEDEKTLSELKKTYQTIVSDWNGSDSRFVSGGVFYTEEDVRSAQDILDAIKNVEGLVDSFKF